ncbi:MAG: hypothetical protein LBU57_00005 [Dysgonamonadaceae bacterium]|jgi:hypothetical protein|nr:hypothetical protein [Dysgonamonadaceae bacterium]
MKRFVLFFVIAVSAAGISVFAGGKCDLTITNETGATISEIVIKQSDTDTEIKKVQSFIEKKGAIAIKIEKNVSYDIILVDTKKHRYGITNRSWSEKSCSLAVTRKDFISQGAWDTFKILMHL